MTREFNIGDMVICKDSGVAGRVLKFYVPTACEEQTLVSTGDGREYHAPTSTWIKMEMGIDLAVGRDISGNSLNPYGEYLFKFAKNHGMSENEASKHPMVKARYKYFCKTGR